MGYKVVVVGATGNVGREMLNILAERQFPVDEIAALASRKSLGTEVSFGDKTLKTQDLAAFDFAGWDIALFAVGSEATKEYAPKAAKAGCTDLRRPLLRHRPAGRHQAEIGIGEIIGRQIAHLERAVAIGHLGADRTARGQCDDFRCRKAAFFEDGEHFAPDIAGCACDCDLECHVVSPSPPGPASFPRGTGPCPRHSFRGTEGNEAEGQTVLVVVLVVALVFSFVV